jgi:hypothetical protein
VTNFRFATKHGLWFMPQTPHGVSWDSAEYLPLSN